MQQTISKYTCLSWHWDWCLPVQFHSQSVWAIIPYFSLSPCFPRILFPHFQVHEPVLCLFNLLNILCPQCPKSDNETGDLASQKQNLQVTGFIVTMHAEQSELPTHFPGCLMISLFRIVPYTHRANYIAANSWVHSNDNIAQPSSHPSTENHRMETVCAAQPG